MVLKGLKTVVSVKEASLFVVLSNIKYAIVSFAHNFDHL